MYPVSRSAGPTLNLSGAAGRYLGLGHGSVTRAGGVDPTNPPKLELLERQTVMAERTRYQEKVIRNYYQNQDAILLQRLGEQVTNLYLADGKTRQKLWKTIQGSLEKLKVPATRIEQLIKKDDAALLARLLEELLAKAS